MSDVNEIDGPDDYTIDDLNDLPDEWDTIDAHRYSIPNSEGIRAELRENDGIVDVYAHNSETGRMEPVFHGRDSQELFQELKDSHLSMNRFIERETDHAFRASSIDWYFLDVRE